MASIGHSVPRYSATPSNSVYTLDAKHADRRSVREDKPLLLDDIISTLSDSKGDLTDALLKTKVLLHSLGRKDLATWVTNELKGYPDGDVPDYRTVSAEVHGHITNLAWQMQDYLLP